MSWYVDAILIGIVLPWIIVTYRLIAAFRQSAAKGVMLWAMWAAACVPVMLLLMWGVTSLRQ
ncbi:conserved hypothetical protein [Rhodopseudomonas palustris HaA2]|uniref:Uncharacterized protein n=1 Tax=Rhodopseudomonas palustris (strain HaA2) TaxID=316058 RepID=Q2ITM2_RHOP2|nr:hypothetical protein [Rhodopseudomonas palustris]ABD08438.1 conserved hypothetical protein [Rhodopseudomonas palustris HaA2]